MEPLTSFQLFDKFSLQDAVKCAKKQIKRIRAREVGPLLYDRKNKMFINEIVPLGTWVLEKIMYSKPIDFIDRWRIIRNALKNENIHDEHVYNKRKSVTQIPQFIDFYRIKMEDFEPSNPFLYKTFNDFFLRRLVEGARPITNSNDPKQIISPADCRLTVYNSIPETHKLYIKGKNFNVKSLLTDGSPENDERWRELSRNFPESSFVANCRLAPMDYHHFHSPVSGRISTVYHIPGQYYTVKPPALNSRINVLGENARTIICIDTENFGKVLFIAIGAEAVGTVRCDVILGQPVEKGQRIGNFEYGGSDIMMLFSNRIEWDEDISDPSQKNIETLIKFGESIGKFF